MPSFIAVLSLLAAATSQAQKLDNSHWAGTWTNPRGYVYFAELQLAPAARDSLEARFRWTLLRSPRANEKIGLSGTEFAHGRYDAATQLLLLQGYRKDDPDSVIGIDGYRLLVANRGDALTGITDDYGTWEGRFSARRVPSGAAARGAVSGAYDLYSLSSPAGTRVTSMSITSAPGIHVSGTDGGGWEGDGRIDGSEGYYDWRFTDGKTGRTTIVVDSDGTLRGHVLGSGLDWWYLAVPAPPKASK
jgi:hypothetical protein